MSPQQHLSLGNHNRRELWNDTRRPWSCGHDQGARVVAIDVGNHPHSIREHVPPAYALAPVNLGSERQGSVEMRDDTALRHQEATVRLVDGDRVVRKRVAGKAAMQIGGVQNVMWKAVLQARAQGAGDDLTVFWTRIDPSGDDQEALIDGPFQIPP